MGKKATYSLPNGRSASVEILVAGGVAAVGAILTALFLPAHPAQPPSAGEPDQAAAPAAEPARPTYG